MMHDAKMRGGRKKLGRNFIPILIDSELIKAGNNYVVAVP